MIDQALQRRIEQYATGFLRQGRVDWDVPHTQAVSYYALLLAERERLDELVMFTTAQLHDIGYFGLFNAQTSSRNWGAVQDKKLQHMIVGAEYARTFLDKPENTIHYSETQAARVVHLVSVHDRVDQLKDPDEIAFGAADTLAAIDVARAKPTFDYEQYKKYLAGSLDRRRRLIQSPSAKELFAQLLPAFIAHFEK